VRRTPFKAPGALGELAERDPLAAASRFKVRRGQPWRRDEDRGLAGARGHRAPGGLQHLPQGHGVLVVLGGDRKSGYCAACSSATLSLVHEPPGPDHDHVVKICSISEISGSTPGL